VTFTLVATGASPISYQWYFNGTAISGATSSSYSIASAQLSNSGSYSVVATNAVSTVTSSGGILSVTAPSGGPVVTAQPLSQTVATGGTVVFSVTPSGVIQTSSDPSGGLRAQSLEALAGSATTYQWYFNGNVIAGATNSILVIKATTATAGSYSCLIKNSTGSIVSNAATLTVSSTSNPGRLVNLSVNAKLNPAVGTPELIMGFVTGGSGTSGSQSLMIRAAGPTLSSYGVTGVLPDPELTAYNGSTSIANNAGWGTPSSNVALVNAAQANTFAGLVYTNTASLDSAVVLSLAPNPGYTVHVDGKSGDSGQTLAEVYDNTPLGTYALTTPRLVNLSCRITVPANGSLTDGFYIGGTTSKTLLIRAIGPGLTQYGVSGAMQDPQITLYSSSTAIATNAGWGGYAQLTAAMTAVYATPNPPATGDSVILVTLPPGSYTAVATSVSGVAGNVLLDIYEVP